MNPIRRLFRSMREHTSGDASFETYYGSILRHQQDGGPTAAEARRDFKAVRASLDRLGMM